MSVAVTVLFAATNETTVLLTTHGPQGAAGADGVDGIDASGDVVGPASATDNAVARFDGATGKLIQDGTLVLDDSGNLTGVRSIVISNGTQSITLSVGLVNGIADLVIT